MSSQAKWARPRGARKLRRLRRLWTIGASALLIAAVVAYLGWSGATSRGHPAPSFVLPYSEGRPVALADYLGRKAVVLVFYMSFD